MDGIANVARQQQTQVNSNEMHARAAQQMQTTQEVSQTKTIQENDTTQKVNGDTTTLQPKESKKEIEDLVKKLNEAMSPLNTDIKFGVDQNDVFYVAAIDAKTHKMIRRFPAEQAQDFLPKMQEVTGILFDSKG